MYVVRKEDNPKAPLEIGLKVKSSMTVSDMVFPP